MPVKTAADLIALAKAKRGKLSFGSYGIGSSNHLVAELFNSMAGIEANHIPYRGSAPMMTDLIGGRIHLRVRWDRDHARLYSSNTVRCSACPPPNAHRPSRWADDLRIGRSGVRSLGLVCPVRAGGHPPGRVDLLNGKLNAALAPPEVRENFLKMGNVPVGGGPDVLAAKVQAELDEMDGDRAREEHPHRAISRNSDHG